MMRQAMPSRARLSRASQASSEMRRLYSIFFFFFQAAHACK